MEKTTENSSVKCSYRLRFKSSGYSRGLSGVFLFVCLDVLFVGLLFSLVGF